LFFLLLTVSSSNIRVAVESSEPQALDGERKTVTALPRFDSSSQVHGCGIAHGRVSAERAEFD
jgi:hypothetical protein